MLRINTSGAALSGGCGCVWVTDVLFPQRSLFHAEQHGSATAGARQPCAAAHSPSGSRHVCLLSSAAQPLQPALVPQSRRVAPRNTLFNSLETPAFWAEM